MLQCSINPAYATASVEYLEEFIQTKMAVVADAKSASSEVKVTRAIISHLQSQLPDVKDVVIKSAIMSVMVFPTTSGARARCRLAAPPRSWLVLNA